VAERTHTRRALRRACQPAMAITEGRGAHGSSESIAAGPPERPEVPPPPPPRTPAFRLERRPTLRGDIAAQCTGTLFQLMIVRKQVRLLWDSGSYLRPLRRQVLPAEPALDARHACNRCTDMSCFMQ
jgi:hypothetical protein